MTNMFGSKISNPSTFILKARHPLISTRQYCQLSQLIKSSSNNVSRSTQNKYSLNNTNFDGLKISNPVNVATRRLQLCGKCHVVAGNTEKYLISDDIPRDNLPEHVAIILDGNRRWLKAHGKPLSYHLFFETNMLFADLCIKWGIGTATTFVYSLKNLQRGKAANDLLFGQLENFLDDSGKFVRKGIRIRVIGQKCELSKTLQKKIIQVEEATKDCTNLEFLLAVCYSGTRDIVEATKNICEKVKIGDIDPKTIDETLLENELSTSDSRAPQVDLVIRTGGRLRVSDYLMWQMAQAELYFSNVCAPEFSETVFLDALRSFQQADRTFGK